MMSQGDGALLTAQGASSVRGVPHMSGPGPAQAAQRNYLQSLHAEVSGKGVYVGMLYEWRILAPVVPAAGTRPGIGGRPGTCPRRDIVDGVRYVTRAGCRWDALPVVFPPAAPVEHHFTTWTRDSTPTRIHNTLREQARQADGRSQRPSAAPVDSQPLRGAGTAGRGGRGYDGAREGRRP
jgi:transposase